MNTKEAIEKVKNLNEILCEETISDIVSALKCGEKFEKMWEEFKDRCGGCEVKNYMNSIRFLREYMFDYEQKYFPSVKENDCTCGTCKHYCYCYDDDDNHCGITGEFCDEQDTCDGWTK